MGGGILGMFKIVPGTSKDKEIIFIVVCAFLTLVGLAIFIYSIINLIKVNKCLKLMKNPLAYETTATFIKIKDAGSTTTSVGVNGVEVPTSINVYKKVVYEYTDQLGTNHTVTSTLKYVRIQAEHLQKLGKFKIKCNGALSVITEELPQPKSNYNF